MSVKENNKNVHNVPWIQFHDSKNTVVLKMTPQSPVHLDRGPTNTEGRGKLPDFKDALTWNAAVHGEQWERVYLHSTMFHTLIKSQTTAVLQNKNSEPHILPSILLYKAKRQATAAKASSADTLP